jgi:hypothetical protein
MTRTQTQTRIREIREELENRYKRGTVKLANEDGTPIAAEVLQNELYSLVYKLSKMA